MYRSLFLGLLSLLVLVQSATADNGPIQNPLRVTTMHTADDGYSVYVEFQGGAMPGCSNNAGGRLYHSNPHFDLLYAQLLTMVATGGIRARVIYTIGGGAGWSACSITGLWLQPAN
jgi:hypothetical protein